MGRQSGQMSMVILDLSELIPENHLLRKINRIISFDFIYDLVGVVDKKEVWAENGCFQPRFSSYVRTKG